MVSVVAMIIRINPATENMEELQTMGEINTCNKIHLKITLEAPKSCKKRQNKTEKYKYTHQYLVRSESSER